MYGVINYEEIDKKLKTIVKDNQYLTICLSDDVIKINCTTPDAYRQLIKYMRKNNVVHHNYQPKEQRAYR